MACARLALILSASTVITVSCCVANHTQGSRSRKLQKPEWDFHTKRKDVHALSQEVAASSFLTPKNVVWIPGTQPRDDAHAISINANLLGQDAEGAVTPTKDTVANQTKALNCAKANKPVVSETHVERRVKQKTKIVTLNVRHVKITTRNGAA